MTRTTPKTTRHLTPARLSARVLYTMAAITAAVFGAFYLIGFNSPFEDDATFNSPLLTDAVIILIYLLVAAAVVLTATSVIASIRRRDRSQDSVNNIPVRRIVTAVVAAIALCMALTFALGSTEPVTVNGTEYTDTFWLRATDMLIYTAAAMLTTATCGVAFILSGLNRKIRQGK